MAGIPGRMPLEEVIRNEVKTPPDELDRRKATW